MSGVEKPSSRNGYAKGYSHAAEAHSEIRRDAVDPEVAFGPLFFNRARRIPQHIKVETYDQAALMFVPVYGRWAVTLFALALGVGCLGAAIEIALNGGYVLAQSFGWSWGVRKERQKAARFAAAFTIVLTLALAIALTARYGDRSIRRHPSRTRL